MNSFVKWFGSPNVSLIRILNKELGIGCQELGNNLTLKEFNGIN